MTDTLQERLLVEALRRIEVEDDTGPVMYELRENGVSSAIGNARGRFSEIARAALAAYEGERT